MSIRVVNVRGIKTPEERAKICYVGRRCAGWPATLWGNPFKPGHDADPLESFRGHSELQPEDWWKTLWEACEHGAKPLGCWCANAEYGDGQPTICHGQILAAGLHRRFVAQVA